MALAGCGGEPLAPDAAIVPDADEGPSGDHHHYVLDSVTVPVDSTQAEALGFDLDGDGTIDNNLGNILSALVQASTGTIDPQATVDTSVASGDILLLADLQALSLTTASNVGFSIYFGEDPVPAPPDHLDGTGAFGVSSGTPDDSTVAGSIVSGALSGGPGTLALQIALPQASAIDLHLLAARVSSPAVAAASIAGLRIGGAIPQADLDDEVVPAVHESVAAMIAQDCTGSGTDCGCDVDSTGLTLLGIFDDNEDCAVPLEEIQQNSLVRTLLRTDVDTDGDGEPDALSCGVGATAVAATFSDP